MKVVERVDFNRSCHQEEQDFSSILYVKNIDLSPPFPSIPPSALLYFKENVRWRVFWGLNSLL